MGNSNVTPSQYAIDCYTAFFESFIDEIKAKDGDDFQKSFTSQADQKFALFFEDFIVNDSKLQEYTTKGQEIVVSSMLFLHSSIPLASFGKSEGEKELSKCIHSESLVKLYGNDHKAVDSLNAFIKSKYVWDGTSFCQWLDDTWTTCPEEAVDCTDFVENSRLGTPIRSLGFTQEVVSRGIASFEEYMKNMLEAASSYKGSDAHLKTIESLKENPKKFDQGNELIPCFSGVVEVSKGALRSYRHTDYFKTKLPYDPVKETTEVVSRCVRNFNCDKTDLATTLVGCSLRKDRTLTIVSGPKGSGKTLVLQLVKALYGPFVCTQEEHKSGSVNYDLVRTCLIDSSSLPSEEKIRRHPCSNLVVTCESSSLEGVFGGRTVRTLLLTAPVDKDNVKTWISKLSTRKQLGSLLGWSLQNYKPSSIKSRLNTKASPDKGCGDSNCTGCSIVGGGLEGSKMPAGLLNILTREGSGSGELGELGQLMSMLMQSSDTDSNNKEETASGDTKPDSQLESLTDLVCKAGNLMSMLSNESVQKSPRSDESIQKSSRSDESI